MNVKIYFIVCAALFEQSYEATVQDVILNSDLRFRRDIDYDYDYESENSYGKPILPKFNPEVDAKSLNEVLCKDTISTSAIIMILTKRTRQDRLKIAEEYRTLYQSEFIKDVESKVRGPVKDVIVALSVPLLEHYAKQLNSALNRKKTDILIEILSTLNNQEIKELSTIYYKMYRVSLQSAIKEVTYSDFMTLLIELTNAHRDESNSVNKTNAENDAKRLYEAGECVWGTDELMFISIMTKNNYKQLRQISEEYRKLYGHGLEDAIEAEFSGDIKDGLLAMLQVAESIPRFFAQRLHCMRQEELIRIVTSRCDTDIDAVKVYYKDMYKKSLVDDISKSVSGDLKDALLAIIEDTSAGD